METAFVVGFDKFNELECVTQSHKVIQFVVVVVAVTNCQCQSEVFSSSVTMTV